MLQIVGLFAKLLCNLFVTAELFADCNFNTGGKIGISESESFSTCLLSLQSLHFCTTAVRTYSKTYVLSYRRCRRKKISITAKFFLILHEKDYRIKKKRFIADHNKVKNNKKSMHSISFKIFIKLIIF